MRSLFGSPYPHTASDEHLLSDAASPSVQPQLDMQAPQVFQPGLKEDSPVRKPGTYKEYREGMNPEALHELTRIADQKLNEAEKKMLAIELCLRYEVDGENPVEEICSMFDFKDKGDGRKDFYLKAEHRWHFKGVNTKLGLLEMQDYYCKTLRKRKFAQRPSPLQ